MAPIHLWELQYDIWLAANSATIIHHSRKFERQISTMKSSRVISFVNPRVEERTLFQKILRR